MSYATLAQLRTQIEKSGVSGGGSDTALQLILDAAAAAIDGFCNRPDGFVAISTATARYYPGSGKPYQRIDECVEVTALAVKDSIADDENAYDAWVVGTIGVTTGADVFPARGDPKYPEYGRTPYTLLMIGASADYSVFPSGEAATRGGFRPSTDVRRGLPTVKVTAKWGYAVTAPKQVVEANIVQAARWFKRGEAAWSDTLTNGEMGELQFRKALDPDVQMMIALARLVKPAVGRR